MRIKNINGGIQIRVYLDNQLITYILRSIQKKPVKDVVTLMEMAPLIYLSNIKGVDIQFLFSEESLAEIRRLPEHSAKRKDLEILYYRLKKGKSVIRNSAVSYNDAIATYDSPDILYNHPYSDKDLNEVRAFMQSKGNHNDFDARYIANAMLPENEISVFLTADKKSIWKHRIEIKNKFGVEVKLPSELVDYLKYVR